jgi:1-deoxy-D-xylulose-5-phosphate reductoisomerase
MTRSVVVLGSTGSIGTQALDLAARPGSGFRIVGLAAGGDRVGLLAEQALAVGAEVVGVARSSSVQDLQLAFYTAAQARGYARGDFRLPKIVAGPEAAAEVASWPCDVVLNGMTGSRGLAPTLAALAAGSTLALANKESLVAGGPLVKAAAAPGQIVPVDSEHSALAQCLRGGRRDEVTRLVLTASGGPFRGRSRAELAEVTVADALAHPTWAMGPVVTVNSSTLVNKGLELIEAALLFDVSYDDLAVVVHPQSVVHSLVEFSDGSTLAQVSPPDMRLPIALALAWPDRVPGATAPVDWTAAATWTFEPLDETAFPAVALARDVGRAGGVLPAVFNAANEVAVEAFLASRLPWTGIVDLVERVVDVLRSTSGGPGVQSGLTLADILDSESEARARARELVGDAAHPRSSVASAGGR